MHALHKCASVADNAKADGTFHLRTVKQRHPKARESKAQ
jgi:hypothetical protein